MIEEGMIDSIRRKVKELKGKKSGHKYPKGRKYDDPGHEAARRIRNAEREKYVSPFGMEESIMPTRKDRIEQDDLNQKPAKKLRKTLDQFLKLAPVEEGLKSEKALGAKVKKRRAKDLIKTGKSLNAKDLKDADEDGDGIVRVIDAGFEPELPLTERLGGKGTSRKAGAAKIHPTSGDWPDSDRGAGNRAKKRAGGKVEKKSPTYQAYVLNKEETVDEALVSRRTKDWPKGSIDPSSTKERLAGDLYDLEKQDKRAGWTAAQLRAKKKKIKEETVDEAKIDDVKYGKGKGWDQPDGKSMTKYSARHSYLKKNPPNVRSDRNKRHSAVDVVFHGHDKVERDRKAKHHASKGVKKVKGAKTPSGGKEALKKRFQDQGAMESYQPEVVSEVAPPTKKHERMVKHIKKSYAKDGGLTDQEKSIAYATAWKNYKKDK